MNDVTIVGAGLSGLTAAFQLKEFGISFQILEARDRIGGRINTIKGPIEMGATWFGNQHTHLRKLLTHLQVEYFEQSTQGKISYDLHSQAPAQFADMPAGQPPSFRIKGGTSTLIERLANELETEQVQLNTEIESIEDKGAFLLITDTAGRVYETRYLVITIPPQLLVHQINFEPALPKEFRQLLSETHTWMNESIKFALSYKRPFWKEKGLSGMGFGQVGPIQEIHDHSNAEHTFFALKGFLNPELAHLSQLEREGLVREQVVKLFGTEASEYTAYYDCVWIDEPLTSVKEAAPLMPHQHSGHPLLSQSLMNNKVFLGGTESSPVYGGYMEGAVYAGLKSAQQIQKELSMA